MNTNQLKYIGNNILKNILPLMNNNLLEKLPNKPQKLLKYVKRRISPFISPYISQSLKIKMYEYRMTDEEYLLSFYSIIINYFTNIKKEKKPIISIILSQPGAGKTKLAYLLLKKRKNSVIINADFYKKYNYKLNKIFKEDPFHVSELTAIDSYDMMNNIKEFAIKNNYNIIIECAPANNELIDINFDNLVGEKYRIEYHILAVGDLVSSLSLHYRYEKQIIGINKEISKLTNLNRHDESYRALLKIIKTLPIDKTYIYRRGTQQEKFIPQLLEKNKQKLYLNIILEREKSNKLYALNEGIYGNFLKDFFKIKYLMMKRNAPKEQFLQLKLIFEKYKRYKNLLRYYYKKIN